MEQIEQATATPAFAETKTQKAIWPSCLLVAHVQDSVTLSAIVYSFRELGKQTNAILNLWDCRKSHHILILPLLDQQLLLDFYELGRHRGHLLSSQRKMASFLGKKTKEPRWECMILSSKSAFKQKAEW